MNTLDFNNEQKVAYCIPTTLRDEQIKINIKKIKERFVPSNELKNEPIAIVSFGPSLKDTWEQIKNFKHVITCSGAYKFLKEKGIIANWHVDLEPRAHKVGMLGEPDPKTEFLIASTIHPNYLDYLIEKKANTKLWHIFASEEEGFRVLPRGEYLITGGSSVGLRCLTLARLMGFTDFHIFGMDGSTREDGSHTTAHPNAPAKYFETEYKGKKYLTTPSMLHVAKETERELGYLHDVTYKFYGEGLIQDMAKDFKSMGKPVVDIAYNKPELISKEYIDLNKKLHDSNPSFGMGGSKHLETVLKLSKIEGVKTIGDYGCGKGQLAKSLYQHGIIILEYDPAVEGKTEPLPPVDLLVCTDVLEHIEIDKLPFVLDDLRKTTKMVGYLVISTRQAVKTYANGKNTHNIVQGKEWWEKQLSKYFDIGSVIEKKETSELFVIVGPKKKKVSNEEISSVKFHDQEALFYTPNDTTKWRAKTLLTKEPSTIEWIDSMSPGEVLYDVGANVGGYSILAGKKGLKVYAFEPEVQNYNLLVKNMNLNKLEPNAYCLAISDKMHVGRLTVSHSEPGGSMNSFGESGQQGCFGVSLDELKKMGLPSPDHIKIDVDGLEPLVIEGAKGILSNGLKSLLVEINANDAKHQQIVKDICSMGFEYNPDQVERATRKEGNFKGVAEYVFRKKTLSPAKSVSNTPLKTEPYNHLYVENIIPSAQYNEILESVKDLSYVQIEKSRGTKGYPLRYTAEPTPLMKKLFLSGDFKRSLLEKFKIKDKGFAEDLLLVKDFPGYQIPPHTDSREKIITVLIYLPDDGALAEAGTSMYTPKKKGFVCKKGYHHKFEDFDKVSTMPFIPNSAFIFARTDNSFHGVEPSEATRNVLLYNIRTK